MNIFGCVTQEGIVNNGNCYLVLKDRFFQDAVLTSMRLDLNTSPAGEDEVMDEQSLGAALSGGWLNPRTWSSSASLHVLFFYIANMRNGGRRCGRLN